MLYGWLRRHLTVALFLLILAARPAHARPAPASELTVTLLAAGPGTLQVQGGDGRAFAVRVTAATWVLRRGLVALPRDLAPGETLRVRLGHGRSGGALLVCDAESAEALDAHRRRPLSGTVVSVGGTTWTVQPADSAVPLPVCLSAHTTFQAGGSPVAASAFGAGAAVTITTRGLANGLLSAVSVSEADVPARAGERRPIPRSLSGIILEVRPDLGLLTLQEASGPARTIAVASATRVKFGGQAVGLGDLTAGMRVRVRLGASADAAGNSVATSVSASEAKPAGKMKKRTSNGGASD